MINEREIYVVVIYHVCSPKECRKKKQGYTVVQVFDDRVAFMRLFVPDSHRKCSINDFHDFQTFLRINFSGLDCSVADIHVLGKGFDIKLTS
jgi:hypothetical protein